jgi:hypothetical protein
MPTMPTLDPQRLSSLLQRFINAPSWAESRRIVEAHSELLSDEADALLGRLLEQYAGEAQAVRILEEHRGLLRRCRARGRQRRGSPACPAGTGRIGP